MGRVKDKCAKSKPPSGSSERSVRLNSSLLVTFPTDETKKRAGGVRSTFMLRVAAEKANPLGLLAEPSRIRTHTLPSPSPTGTVNS